MELVVFDLDGTLLNAQSQVSAYTQETLALLAANNIAYTVATGRTLQSAKPLIDGCGFSLPHIYNNGIVVFNPESTEVTLEHLLPLDDARHVIETAQQHGLAAFVAAIGADMQHSVFHPEVVQAPASKLLQFFESRPELNLQLLSTLDDQETITNIIMLGAEDTIQQVMASLEQHPSLLAYSGVSNESDAVHWLDVHHSQASKGAAVTALKQQLGASTVICFGDSDNDASLFEAADEAYAPANAKDHIKDAATAIIGHHDEDGIARFLRQRFSL